MTHPYSTKPNPFLAVLLCTTRIWNDSTRKLSLGFGWFTWRRQKEFGQRRKFVSCYPFTQFGVSLRIWVGYLPRHVLLPMVVSSIKMGFLSSIKKYLISVVQDWRFLDIFLEIFVGMSLTMVRIVPFMLKNELFWVKTKKKFGYIFKFFSETHLFTG